MKLKVTEKGVLIPKELLGESQEVEVTQEQEKIIITTIKKTSSIWELGTNPVECDSIINPDEDYPIYSPLNAFEAADTLLKLLAENNNNNND